MSGLLTESRESHSASLYSGTVPLPEKALIEQIRRMAGVGRRRQADKSVRPTRARSTGIVAGIGDDCAVLRLRRGHETLVTTDFSLEGIHFRRDWHPPESVGHRCLARGLSDIAAMGGEPAAAFLSLALPRDLSQAWVRRFVRALIGLAITLGLALYLFASVWGHAGGRRHGRIAGRNSRRHRRDWDRAQRQGCSALRRSSRRPHLCERRAWRVGGGGSANAG